MKTFTENEGLIVGPDYRPEIGDFYILYPYEEGTSERIYRFLNSRAPLPKELSNGVFEDIAHTCTWAYITNKGTLHSRSAMPTPRRISRTMDLHSIELRAINTNSVLAASFGVESLDPWVGQGRIRCV